MWSLGVTLYELATGQLPFKGRHYSEVLDAIRTADPARPGSIAEGVGLDVETIILHCLRKEPSKRYASAAELAADIAAVLRGEAIKARPVGQWERAGRRLVRYPATYAAVFFALLMAAVYTAVIHDASEPVQDDDLRRARLEQLEGNAEALDQILLASPSTAPYARLARERHDGDWIRIVSAQEASRRARNDPALEPIERAVLLAFAAGGFPADYQSLRQLEPLLGNGRLSAELGFDVRRYRLHFVTDPPDAIQESWPRHENPYDEGFRNLFRFTAPSRGDAWLYVPQAGRLECDLQVKLPASPPPGGFVYMSDGMGSGILLSTHWMREGSTPDRPPLEFTNGPDAVAATIALGGRLPTFAELEILRALASSGLPLEYDAKIPEWATLQDPPAGSPPAPPAPNLRGYARVVRDAP
ncbi:MAG: serine/threonine protein [Planctomycetota bacterium]|nr:MAG: serine/threonine protein [Planctomycetota bacterium]